MIEQLLAIKQIAQSCASREEMWCAIVSHCKVAHMTEVGVFRGKFAQTLLQNCAGIEHYTMIDPWQQLKDWHKPANFSNSAFGEIHAEAMRRTGFARDKITVLRARTSEAARHIPAQSLDLAYIDGDHSLRGITIDLLLMFEKIKPGGMIGGDDFTRTIWQHGPDFDPTFICPYAIYFAEAMNVPIIALPYQQFLILKDSSMGFELIHFTDGYKNLRLNQLAKLPGKANKPGQKPRLKGASNV